MVLLSALTSTRVQGAVSSGVVDQRGKHFVTSSRCPGRVLSPVHSYFTGVVHSALQCVLLCARNVSCLSAVHDPQRSSCRLGPADCQTGLRQHGGSIVRQQTFRTYCTDAYNRGLYNDTMVVEVYPLLAQQPFRVNCKMKSNVRTYIMDHNSDALLNFNRSFNVITSWGSETCPPTIGWGWRSKTYELRVTATLQNKSTVFQQYQEFNISDAASGYRLYFNRNVSTYLLGDCFTPLLGAPFSAHDNDNDGDASVNCALQHAAGFWFVAATAPRATPWVRYLSQPPG
ncbi:hypothetical protein C0Q70_02186 [Pomacea canaliculata]|uniref:Fibrinogen C-terminal domain-containing protein n=1 Tax=Pomacea canaliculata TaxID=400727 RepID=A0A2T7Q1K0_POMCA|nr:hypothetical protein C0Q70_02186 [Pomacea canaliculata]